MPDTATIHPNGVYGTDDLCAMPDASPQTVAEARRLGALRWTRVGRRVVYLGEWVLAWLRSEGQGKEATHAS